MTLWWTLDEDRQNTHPGGPSWCLDEHRGASVTTVARFYVESEGREAVTALTLLQASKNAAQCPSCGHGESYLFKVGEWCPDVWHSIQHMAVAREGERS